MHSPLPHLSSLHLCLTSPAELPAPPGRGLSLQVAFGETGTSQQQGLSHGLHAASSGGLPVSTEVGTLAAHHNSPESFY